MPTSVPYCVPIIAGIARQLRPASVLDVGVGFGKYGYLFREYLDIWDMERVPDYGKERWRTRIDGVEATRDYLTPLHEFLYDDIHVGDVLTLADQLDCYDVIVMGDVLEHFEKEAGLALLDKLYARTNKCLILTFPARVAINHDVLGNAFEAHRSRWRRKDFRRFPQVDYKLVEHYTALVAITKPPQLRPLLTPSFAARRRIGWKGALSWLMVRTLGAANASRLASRVLGEQVALRG